MFTDDMKPITDYDVQHAHPEVVMISMSNAAASEAQVSQHADQRPPSVHVEADGVSSLRRSFSMGRGRSIGSRTHGGRRSRSREAFSADADIQESCQEVVESPGGEDPVRSGFFVNDTGTDGRDGHEVGAADDGGPDGPAASSADTRSAISRDTSGQGQPQEAHEGQQACSSDRNRGPVPLLEQRVLGRCDLQPDALLAVSDPDIQMEDLASTAQGQTSSRGGEAVALEAQSQVDHASTRATCGSSVGAFGSGSATMLQSQDLPLGLGSRTTGTTCPAPTQTHSSGRPLLDPHAQQDALDIVTARDLPPGQGPDATVPLPDPPDLVPPDAVQPDNPPPVAEVHALSKRGRGEPCHTPVFTSLLNRGQQTVLRKGVQAAKARWECLEQMSKAQPRDWSLLELFAGKATLSLMAKDDGWCVLHPQDVALGGLDLKLKEHRELIKDVIQTQQPDVVTISPRCGPWSSWQRVRKNRAKLRAERKEELPISELIAWIWEYQTEQGALALLEQPQQSEALQLPVMVRRRVVYEKIIHQCAAGLKDAVSGKPRKKATVFQANHNSIDYWRDLLCDHEPGAHQPIEGSVTIVDEEGRSSTVKRSTLAASWTPELCAWILDGASYSLAIMNGYDGAPESEPVIPLHQPSEGERIWHAVPVEVEQNPDALLRQQLAQQSDVKTKYDYITFKGVSATLSRQLRNNLAHLHA